MRGWSRRCAPAITLVLLASLAAAASGWEKVSDKYGVLVERRPVAGSPFAEVRATAQSELPPAAIFETVWNQREYTQFVPHLTRLDILSDTGDERVTYEQVAVPLARNRDYAVRLHKRVDAVAQRYEIDFATANDLAPPRDGRHERVRSIQGSWLIEPDPVGAGSVVRYKVAFDPGGSIPAWIANRAERHTVTDLVRAMLRRAWEKSSR
jgi:ribosome-associated toxin RatA of RatAB toxin-antitoxin module